ncbi:MAG: hypothetical protein GQ535_00325 [Rhodobacteraceae bacterium]|nr:hypothetical protein [Paracoccaceae bacterium]
MFDGDPNTINAISAAMAAFAALVAVCLSAYALVSQRRHDRAALKPIAHTVVWDYSDHLAVELRNVGVGPMKILQISIYSTMGGTTFSTIVEHFREKDIPIKWTHFAGNLEGRILAPGDRTKLVLLKGSVEDNGFIEDRNAARKELAKLTVTIEYQDIFNVIQEVSSKSLSLFGRHYFFYNYETQSLDIKRPVESVSSWHMDENDDGA